MRRSAFLIAVPAFFIAACDAAGPVDPSQSPPSGISSTVRNDSTAAAGDADAVSGGIMIGSGT